MRLSAQAEHLECSTVSLESCDCMLSLMSHTIGSDNLRHCEQLSGKDCIFISHDFRIELHTRNISLNRDC